MMLTDVNFIVFHVDGIQEHTRWSCGIQGANPDMDCKYVDRTVGSLHGYDNEDVVVFSK